MNDDDDDDVQKSEIDKGRNESLARNKKERRMDWFARADAGYLRTWPKTLWKSKQWDASEKQGQVRVIRVMASFLGTGPSFGHALETGAGSGYTRSNAKKTTTYFIDSWASTTTLNLHTLIHLPLTF